MRLALPAWGSYVPTENVIAKKNAGNARLSELKGYICQQLENKA